MCILIIVFVLTVFAYIAFRRGRPRTQKDFLRPIIQIQLLAEKTMPDDVIGGKFAYLLGTHSREEFVVVFKVILYRLFLYSEALRWRSQEIYALHIDAYKRFQPGSYPLLEEVDKYLIQKYPDGIEGASATERKHNLVICLSDFAARYLTSGCFTSDAEPLSKHFQKRLRESGI